MVIPAAPVRGLGEPRAVVAVGPGGTPHVRLAELGDGERDDQGDAAGRGYPGQLVGAAAGRRAAGERHAVGEGLGEHIGDVDG